MIRRTALTAVAALALAAPAGAAPVGTVCTTHAVTSWHREKLRVKRHGHWHVVYHRVRRHGRLVRVPVYHRVRVRSTATVCVAAATAKRLHAHLDPSYVQDPSNPLHVTYSYSASATQTTASQPLAAEAEAPAELPAGILSLYSDGQLACSINVGGQSGAGECPVTYAATGEHVVTVQYISGPVTVTETELEDVAPLATTTGVTVGEHLQDWDGELTLDATVEGPAGQLGGRVRWCLLRPDDSWDCYSGPQHLSFAVSQAGSSEVAIMEDQAEGVEHTPIGGLLAHACEWPGVCGPYGYTRPALESGELTVRAEYVGAGGFAASSSEPTGLAVSP